MEEPGWHPKRNRAAIVDTIAACELKNIRRRIDELDKLTAQLLVERLQLTNQLPNIKSRLGLPIQDPTREDDVLSRISASIDDKHTSGAIRQIYQAIIEQSLYLQQRRMISKTEEPVENDSLPNQVHTDSNLTKKPIYFPRIHIIGLGLIGGMLARLIKNSVPQTIISAEDSAEIIASALTDGVIDIGAVDSTGARKRASLIILAATPSENMNLLRKLAPKLRRRQMVIDVTSTKREICELSESLNFKADFIGGHPLFGSEKSGYSESKTLNPQGKTFCVVPTKGSSEMAVRRLCRWLTLLGLKVKIVDATTHDALLAKLSHVVQLLTVALGVELAKDISNQELSEVLSLSGTSLNQLSRLMASPAQLWTEIVSQNRAAISSALSDLSEQLSIMIHSIETGDNAQLEELFKIANRVPECLGQMPNNQ